MITKQCPKCKKVYPDTPENFRAAGAKCRSCHDAYDKKYHEEHREQRAARAKLYYRKYRRQLRFEVLSHYAPKGLQCACCGEDHVEFLCLDHINGHGGQHRKSVKGNLYNWLKKRGFPEGYRVLCHNCNAALGYYGYCPHKR